MRKRYIDELLEAMTFGKRYLTENTIFEDYDYPEYAEEMPPQEGMPPQGQMPQGEEGEEGEMKGQDLSMQDERIAQIREVALDGLQEYCEDVDSEMYQFYKKIWLMCDKAVSENDSAGD